MRSNLVSVITFVLLLSCIALGVLLTISRSQHLEQQTQANAEIRQLRNELEQVRQDEIKLKRFALQQMRETLNDPAQLSVLGFAASQLATDLIRHYPQDTYLWFVLLKTKVLYDGISLNNAKKILGEPTKFTTEPAYEKPPYYEWHSDTTKLAADVVDGQLKFWRQTTTTVGGY